MSPREGGRAASEKAEKEDPAVPPPGSSVWDGSEHVRDGSGRPVTEGSAESVDTELVDRMVTDGKSDVRAPALRPWAGPSRFGGRTDRPAARGLTLVLLAAVLGTVACNPFSAPDREEARAVVTTEQEAEVRIVTSRQFALAGGGEPGAPTDVILEAADTSLVVPPFDRTFDISQTKRFFIRVEPTDTLSVLASLEVFIDGESLGRLEGDLQEQPLQDVFLSAEF